jgi:hypothetical protein
VLRLAGQSGPVVVDAGRVTTGSPALPLAVASDAVLVLARPRWDDVAHAAASIQLLREAGVDRVGLVLRTGGPLKAREISDAVGVSVVAGMVEDRVGARILRGELVAEWGWNRLGLARTGRGIALLLRERIPTLNPTPAPAAAPVAPVVGRRVPVSPR